MPSLSGAVIVTSAGSCLPARTGIRRHANKHLDYFECVSVAALVL
jgi:hypothetical protein